MIAKKEIEFAKELDDCMAFVVLIVADIKAGKAAMEIAADALPKLIEAIAGVDGVKGEFDSARGVALSTIGLRTGELTDILLGKPAPVQP